MFRTRFCRTDYDVIVVGARCAGASTAMLLAQGGARVLAVDRAAYGADTMSTHALMRAGVVQLHRWGLLNQVKAAGTPPVRRTTFHYGGAPLPVDIKPRDGIDALYAPRRRLLDRILVDAARAAGAEVRFRLTFQAVKSDGQGRVRGVHLRDRDGRSIVLRAPMVIGADGVRSAVAEQVRSRVFARSAHRTAAVYGYFAGLEDKGYRWFYRQGSSAGVIPTNDGLHCVFACLPPDWVKGRLGGGPFEGLLNLIAASDEGLARQLDAAGPQDGISRFGGINGHLRQAYGPGWALVGDAGYFKDPITAHGISDALLDAERLATAILTGGDRAMAGYQAERDRFARPLFGVTDAIAAFDWDLEEIQCLHAALNACMKAELAGWPDVVPPPRQAA